MSAMPPSANATSASSALPGLAAIAPKAHTGSKETNPGAGDQDGAEQFSAHFQRLIDKQSAGQILTETLAMQSNPATPGAPPAPELAALLPFIEALGLIPASAEAAVADKAPVAAETAATQVAGDAEPSLLAAPAISAANQAPQEEVRNLPIAPAARGPQASGAAAPDEARPLPAGVPAARGAAEEASGGREFSAQLVAAIGASKEQGHAAGNTSAAVQQLIAGQSPPPASTAAVHPGAVIARPVGASGWSEEIGNHVVWLANRSENRAELVLTPPQMGRVEISLTVKGDQATASFVSANPVVREALEAALPRLREMLADAGIQLGQAQVGAENARQWAQQDKHVDNSASDPARAQPGDGAISLVNSGGLSTGSGLKGGRGLVDVFA